MLISKKHKKLVFNLKEPSRITAVIPTAKTLVHKGTTLVAVPHKLEEVRVLRNLGFDVPAPMSYYYDWPGRYKPYAHQQVTSEFLTINPRAFCLNGMGSGKTVSVLWSFDYLKKLGLVKRMLIISPLSTLERAWGDEIFRHFPELTFTVLHGDRAKRHKLLACDFDIYIINHDGIKAKETLDLLATRDGLDIVVIDECFPAGTLVDTPAGPQPIETLKLGDTVNSSWGPKPITHVFKKHTNTLVEVKFDNGQTIKCTPEHPFATDHGWVAAKDLAGRFVLSNGGLRQLQHDIFKAGVPTQECSQVLQPGMLPEGLRQYGSSCGVPPVQNLVSEEAVEPASILQLRLCEHIEADGRCGCNEGVCGVQRGVFCAVERSSVSPPADVLTLLLDKTQMGSPRSGHARGVTEGVCEAEGALRVEQGDHNTAGCFGENRGDAQGQQGSVSQHTRGQRSGHVGSGECSCECDATGIFIQPGNSHEAETGQRISDMLQSGLWKRPEPDSGGSGRPQSQHAGTAGSGHQENGVFAGSRVASVTHQELDSPEHVWNIEVEGPHDYVAGGFVVHNCASFRNAATDRWKALNFLVNGHEKRGLPPKQWVWGLTGTPTPNAPTDAWAQSRLISPTRVARYFGQFRDAVMRQAGPHKFVARDGATEIVKHAMQPSVRFAREDCIDLPPTTYVTRETTLTPDQAKAFNQMLTRLRAEHEGGQITAVNEAVKMSKLLQICCGCAYGADGSVIDIPATPRIELVREIIEEAEGKVLVFVPLTAALKTVAAELAKTYSVAIVHGETSKHQRDEIFKEFQQANNPRVLVANPGTLSHGLTLTAANVVVWFAPIFSNETFQQANARVTRPGQTRNTLIVSIEATTMERKIYEKLQGKQKMQGLLLDLLKEG